MTNTALLREKILQSGLKYKFLAGKLGLSEYGFRRKVNNLSEFKAREIEELSCLLVLTKSERDQIFFYRSE